MYLQLFQDKNKHWRIRLKATNGKVVMSGEAYSSKRKALKTARSIIAKHITVIVGP